MRRHSHDSKLVQSRQNGRIFRFPFLWVGSSERTNCKQISLGYRPNGFFGRFLRVLCPLSPFRRCSATDCLFFDGIRPLGRYGGAVSHPTSIRRHPVHAARRLAQLAGIGFRHPRSRSRVLEFDQPHNSDGLIATLQSVRGMPLLLSDQLLLLGGSVAPSTEFAAVMGGRARRQFSIETNTAGVRSVPYTDPDIAVDCRIAEKVLRHVGFLAQSEVALASAILRQAVEDVAVDGDESAACRALFATSIVDLVPGARAMVTGSGELTHECPATPGQWSTTTGKALAELVIRLLFGHGCVLRHLSQRTVVPTADHVWLTCTDSVRRVPSSAVAAARALIEGAAGDDHAMHRLVAHLYASSDGAESAAKFAGAAQWVVARSADVLLDLLAREAAPTLDNPDLARIDEPFATCLVISQVVFAARVLESTGHTDHSAVIRNDNVSCQ